MSDTYIPGVKSRFDTDKMIADLMKLERAPRDRADKEVKDLESKKGIWLDLGRRMTTLRESSKALYSFQNPFTDRVAKSSDESIISGTATREAVEQERSFIVKRIATSDRFLSKPLAGNYRVGAGDYHFNVGKDEIDFQFKGGSLSEFTEALNRRGKDKIKASILVVEPGTKSLLIEALVTGSQNRLGFSNGAEKLALDAGMVSIVDSQEQKFSLAEGSAKPVSGSFDTGKVLFSDGAMEVKAKGEARLPLSPAIPVSGELSLEFDLKTTVRTEAETATAGPPPGPTLPAPSSVTYGGITIENDLTAAPQPPWKTPEKPQRVDDPAVLNLTFTDGSTAQLPAVEDSADFKHYTYRLADFAGSKTLAAIDLVNRNTHRDIDIKGVHIFDPAASGGVKPLKAISTAGDATVVMDGIEVTRPSNDIKDLIPGVTVTARGVTDTPVKLKIEPDREEAKNAVIALVGNYNRLMADINVLSRNDDKLVRELDYLKDDERKEMEKKLGAMQGDSTLNQIKQNLQRSSSSAYKTSLEKEMALLAQIGVSTDARRGGTSGSVDQSRLRGYLEIDEKILDKALQDKLPAVKELFGYDTDNDKVIDSGFAWAVDNLTRAYVETGGILAIKTGTIDTQVAQDKKRIETMDKQLEAKETELKTKYGMMEGSLNSMDRTSASLDQFSNQKE